LEFFERQKLHSVNDLQIRNKIKQITGVEGARGGAVVEALRYKPKIARSIPDSVFGIFHLHNLSGRTMALGSTQPPTEMSTWNVSWG
jgi:hypothetical protein